MQKTKEVIKLKKLQVFYKLTFTVFASDSHKAEIEGSVEILPEKPEASIDHKPNYATSTQYFETLEERNKAYTVLKERWNNI